MRRDLIIVSIIVVLFSVFTIAYLKLQKEPKWQIDPQEKEFTSENLKSIWIKEDGTEGWAVGEYGEIMHFNDGFWKKDIEASKLTNLNLSIVWMNDHGTEGWAGGGPPGVLLKYQNGNWEEVKELKNITINTIMTMWMNKNNTEGWAVGGRGEILNYKNNKWTA